MKYDWEKSVSMPDKYSQIATSHRPLILTCQLQKLPHGATDWARQYKPSPTSSILSQTHVSSIFQRSSVYLLTSIVYLTLFFSRCVAVESRKPQLVIVLDDFVCKSYNSHAILVFLLLTASICFFYFIFSINNSSFLCDSPFALLWNTVAVPVQTFPVVFCITASILLGNIS